MKSKELIDLVDAEQHRIQPGAPVDLDRVPSFFTGGFDDFEETAVKAQKKLRRELADLQEKLFAEGEQALLLVLQAMDTGGKDSTIRVVTKGVNPQGCEVYGFKAPSKNELARDYLWRVHQQVPRKGHIGIFNRSHYEDVLIVKVHGWASPQLTEARYGHINSFERLLHDHGTRVVKVMLHISKDYQRQRLIRRLERPEKHWKFNPGDLKERALWGKYMEAYEVALSRCSTETSPWYVVPAEARWYRNLVITKLLVDTLKDMDPQFPEPEFDPSEFPPEAIV